MIVFVLAAAMVQTGGIVYGQMPDTLKDWSLDPKKYYLEYIDINTACNEKGFDSEKVADACRSLMIEYGKVMRELFAKNSDLVDIILYSP